MGLPIWFVLVLFFDYLENDSVILSVNTVVHHYCLYWKFNESVLTNSFYCLPNSYEIILRDEKMARENEKIQQNILSTNFLRKQKSKRGSVKKGIKTGSRETVKPRFLAHCGVWREIGTGWQNRSKNVKKTVWFGLVSSSAKLASKPKTQWVHFKSHS